MTSVVTATEAKAKLLAILDEVANGSEIEITKRGKPVARLIPARGAESLKDKLAGIAVTATENEEDLFSTGAEWSLR